MLRFSIRLEPESRAWKQPEPKPNAIESPKASVGDSPLPAQPPSGGACASPPIRFRPPGGGAALPGDRRKRRPGAGAGTRNARPCSVLRVSLEARSREVPSTSPSDLLASQGAVSPTWTSLRLNQRSPGSLRPSPSSLVRVGLTSAEVTGIGGIELDVVVTKLDTVPACQELLIRLERKTADPRSAS